MAEGRAEGIELEWEVEKCVMAKGFQCWMG